MTIPDNDPVEPPAFSPQPTAAVQWPPKRRSRKGIPNKIPTSLKNSIKYVAYQIGRRNPKLFYEAFRRGLEAKPPISFPYLQLAAHYLDGKPREKIELETTERRFVIILNTDADPLADRSSPPSLAAFDPSSTPPPSPPRSPDP